ncbi:TetR/AcrR family transcriptional regulator [Alicyclobacillus fodiniaquatilis]|uniref:TetR/AcrR family transcriptional regulator n=1 Tax=Alicyclobacillus fodiniaquatilis TaxID=1661150 RepID=A0ABW4JQZ2_9BACL
MDGFEKRRETKKAQIRHAVLLLLTTQSEDFTIRKVALQAGVSQVSIYNFFGSKDGLLMDVLKTYIKDKTSMYSKYLEDDLSFEETIQVIMMEEKKILSLTHSVLAHVAQPQELMNLLKKLQEAQLVPILIALMEMAKSQGVINEDLAIADLLFYISMYQREMLRLSNQDRAAEPEISEEKLIHFFFYGLIGVPKQES